MRLARFIQYFATQYGTETTKLGECLKVKLPYYQIARSIGITYEECVRLTKSLKSVIAYSRGVRLRLLIARHWKRSRLVQRMIISCPS